MEVSLWALGTLPAGERRRAFAPAGAGAWVIWLRYEGREDSPPRRARNRRAFGLVSLGPLSGARAQAGWRTPVALGCRSRPHARPRSPRCAAIFDGPGGRSSGCAAYDA